MTSGIRLTNYNISCPHKDVNGLFVIHIIMKYGFHVFDGFPRSLIYSSHTFNAASPYAMVPFSFLKPRWYCFLCIGFFLSPSNCIIFQTPPEYMLLYVFTMLAR